MESGCKQRVLTSRNEIALWKLDAIALSVRQLGGSKLAAMCYNHLLEGCYAGSHPETVNAEPCTSYDLANNS